MDDQREAFLAGERPTDVHIYLAETAVSDLEPLEPHGHRVTNGIVLLLDGEKGRSVFQSTTGIDPMALAKEAMATDGEITTDCAGGNCPSCGEPPEIVFSFAEEQNEDVGGLYAEGPVIHAYATCECGQRYSKKWVVEE